MDQQVLLVAVMVVVVVAPLWIITQAMLEVLVVVERLMELVLVEPEVLEHQVKDMLVALLVLLEVAVVVEVQVRQEQMVQAVQLPVQVAQVQPHL
jgi:hypothetical protein